MNKIWILHNSQINDPTHLKYISRESNSALPRQEELEKHCIGANRFRNGVGNSLSYLLGRHCQEIWLNEQTIGGTNRHQHCFDFVDEHQGHTVKNYPAPNNRQRYTVQNDPPTNKIASEQSIWIEGERESGGRWSRSPHQGKIANTEETTVHWHTTSYNQKNYRFLVKDSLPTKGNSLNFIVTEAPKNPKLIFNVVSSNHERHNQQVNTSGYDQRRHVDAQQQLGVLPLIGA